MLSPQLDLDGWAGQVAVVAGPVPDRGTEAIDRYGIDMVRSRTFSLILLAMNHLVAGDVEQGVDAGFRALACAQNLASLRVRDWMRTLKVDVERYDSHSGALGLAVRIAAFTAPRGHKP